MNRAFAIIERPLSYACPVGININLKFIDFFISKWLLLSNKKFTHCLNNHFKIYIIRFLNRKIIL